MKKFFCAFAALSLASVSAFAAVDGTVTKTHEFAIFEGIEISNSFEATLALSDEYSAEWTVDEALGNYVEVYVKGKVLYVGLTKDGVSYVRKNYKGKDSPDPVLKVTISMPEFKSLTLKDNSVAHALGVTFKSDKFDLNLTDKSSASNLELEVEGAFTAEISKTAKADINVTAKSIAATTENSSSLVMEQFSQALTLNSSGSSSQSVKGDANNVAVKTKGSSKIFLSGTGAEIQLEGQGSSVFNGIDFSVKKAVATLGGSTVLVNAEDEITIDIKSGSQVIFSGDPAIKIVDVSKSSITRYENVKK